MGLFDLVFLPMHYKNGYDLGKPFVISSIMLFVAIVLLEALDHIVPYMKTVCESYTPADLVRQLPVLLGGMAVYALEVLLPSRTPAARFAKLELQNSAPPSFAPQKTPPQAAQSAARGGF